MRRQYQHDLDRLKPDDVRWPTALRAVGFMAKRQKQDAAAMGLGSAVQMYRDRRAANRAKSKAARKHRLATR